MQVFLTVFWDAVHKWAVVYAWPSIATAAISISDANFGVSGAIRAYCIRLFCGPSNSDNSWHQLSDP